MNKTAEKALELSKSDVMEAFRGMTEISLSDAIRAGSSNTKQEVGGWGDGETACALSAARLTSVAMNL